MKAFNSVAGSVTGAAKPGCCSNLSWTLLIDWWMCWSGTAFILGTLTNSFWIWWIPMIIYLAAVLAGIYINVLSCRTVRDKTTASQFIIYSKVRLFLGFFIGFLAAVFFILMIVNYAKKGDRKEFDQDNNTRARLYLFYTFIELAYLVWILSTSKRVVKSITLEHAYSSL